MSTECCDNDQKENKKNLMNKNEDTRNSLKIEDSPSRLKRQSPNSGCKNCSGCNGDLITRSPFSSPSKGSVTARMKQETPISKKGEYKNKSEHPAISIKDHGQKKSMRSWHVSSESSKEPVLSNELQIETLKVKGRPRLPWDELSKSSKERRMKELRRQSLPVYLADANQNKKGIFVSLQNIKKKTVKQKPQNVESVKIYTPPGWRREVKLRKSGLTEGIKDVFYISPTGKRFQHKRALESYCLKESIDVDFDRISFSCNNSPETTLKKNIAKKPGPVPKKDLLKSKNHKQNYTSKRKPASKNKVVANRIRGTKRAAELNKRRTKILAKNLVREIQTSTSKTLTMQANLFPTSKKRKNVNNSKKLPPTKKRRKINWANDDGDKYWKPTMEEFQQRLLKRCYELDLIFERQLKVMEQENLKKIKKQGMKRNLPEKIGGGRIKDIKKINPKLKKNQIAKLKGKIQVKDYVYKGKAKDIKPNRIKIVRVTNRSKLSKRTSRQKENLDKQGESGSKKNINVKEKKQPLTYNLMVRKSRRNKRANVIANKIKRNAVKSSQKIRKRNNNSSVEENIKSSSQRIRKSNNKSLVEDNIRSHSLKRKKKILLGNDNPYDAPKIKKIFTELVYTQGKLLSLSQPEPEFINEQFQRSPTKYGEYQVEEIIARREQQGKNEYLVKWQGWSPSKNTWEPVEHMHGCQRMLKEYKEHLKQRENIKRNLWENKDKQNVACSKSSNSNQDEMTYSVPITDGKRKRNHQIFNEDQDNLVQADSVTIEITEPEIDSVTMSALTKLKENTTINNYECDNEYKDNFFAVAQSPQTIVIKTPMKKMIQEIKERRITGVKRKLDEANENNDSEDSSSVDTTIVTDIDAMNQTIVNLACSICGAHQSLCFRKSNGSASPAKLKLFCITCKNYIGNSERDKCHSVDSEYNEDGVVVIEKEELNAEYLKHDKKINLKDLKTIRRGSPRKKNSSENLVSFKTVKFYGARRKEIQNENISSPYPKLKNSENILSPSENEPLRKRRSLTEKQNNAENIASNKNLSSREKLQNKNENCSVEASPSNRYKNKNKEEKCNEPTIEQVNVVDDKNIRIPKLSVELMKAGNEEENSVYTNKNDTDPLEIDDISYMKIKCEKVHAKKQSIVKHYEIGEILIPSIESDKFPSVDNSFPNTPPGSEEENSEDPLGVSLIPGIVF